jgi:hypothetical protein
VPMEPVDPSTLMAFMLFRQLRQVSHQDR